MSRTRYPKWGRVSSGVKCIKLDEGDEVVYFGQITDEGEDFDPDPTAATQSAALYSNTTYRAATARA